MHGRRTAVLASAAVLVLATPGAAAAAPIADFEMPFPCGQTWTGTTRDSHSPSKFAVDWNRADDVDDPVVASASGQVVVADAIADSGYGRWVTIDHGNGESTLYAHLNSVTVTAGQTVDQGQLIGTVGSTGNSSAPHLHFEQRLNGSVTAPYFHQTMYAYGTALASRNCVDVPLAPDWNGNNLAQPTVFRRGEPSTFQIHRDGRVPRVVPFGGPTDEPVTGDWDGDGTINPGVRTPGTRVFTLRTPAGYTRTTWGKATDRPIAGNWDGDARWELGLWRASTGHFILRLADGTNRWVKLGGTDDLPIVGDWDADGISDLGVFDQATATFRLRRVDAEGVVWIGTVKFGSPGDLPVTGDWDGNGRTDLGVWTPTTGVFTKRIATAPTATMRSTSTLKFGRAR